MRIGVYPTAVKRSTIHRHAKPTRLAILLIALWQIGIVATPHTGSFSGATSQRPHLHATGDTLEPAHDETACPACNIQQLVETAPQTALPPVASSSRPVAAADVHDRPIIAFTADLNLSRAPPFLV